jgi:hypothetical protein
LLERADAPEGDVHRDAIACGLVADGHLVLFMLIAKKVAIVQAGAVARA